MADQTISTHSFRATLAAASQASVWLEGVAQRLHAGPDETYALQVCLEEVLANIVMHNPGRTPDVVLILESEASGFKLTITDTGLPFDLAAATPHRATGSLEDLQPGGLGIQLIRSFSSQIAYRRDQDTNSLVVCVPKTTQCSG